MCMIKNAYFCVAKVQCDNPEGFFYLILLGTDGLEKVFECYTKYLYQPNGFYRYLGKSEAWLVMTPILISFN